MCILEIWVSGCTNQSWFCSLHPIIIFFWFIYEGGLREPASGQICLFGRGQKLQTPVSSVFLCTLTPALYFFEPHMIQKPVLRIELCTRALRASQNVKKRCVPCVFALLKLYAICQIALSFMPRTNWYMLYAACFRDSTTESHSEITTHRNFRNAGVSELCHLSNA